jgi:hypothetical protein
MYLTFYGFLQEDQNEKIWDEWHNANATFKSISGHDRLHSYGLVLKKYIHHDNQWAFLAIKESIHRSETGFFKKIEKGSNWDTFLKLYEEGETNQQPRWHVIHIEQLVNNKKLSIQLYDAEMEKIWKEVHGEDREGN